jgi:hypothetical protein
MAHTPDDSAIRVNATLEEKLRGATHEEIKELLKEAAVSQSLAVREWDQSILTPTELAGTAPKQVGKVIVLNGVKHSLVAEDEAGLLAQENGLYRAALEQPVTTQQIIEPLRNERGQFVSAEDADRANQLELVRRTELDLKFKRGEISAADFIEQSGAVQNYLEKAGVPMEDLRSAVQEKSSQRFEQSWAQATEEFLHSPEGSDWIGGEENKNILGRLIAENQLIDQPSAATLAKIWNHMKENSLAVENADTSYQQELSEAQSPSEINAVNHKYFGGSGSGLFNR